MENQKNNSSLKAIVIVLAVLLAGSLAYIFTLTSEATKTQVVLQTTKSEKESVMKDLET